MSPASSKMVNENEIIAEKLNDGELFKRCSREKVRSFVSNAMDVVFTKIEMVNGSTTGKPPNFYAMLPDDKRPKRKKLDEDKIRRIKCKNQQNMSKLNTFIREK